MAHRYFTPAEVSAHNTAADLWLSFLGTVSDLTPLMEQHAAGGALLVPIMASAGQDVSSWFDQDTKDLQRHVDPLTSCVRYYTPRGRFLHIPPTGPRSDWATDTGPPWWRDQRYQVGLLTSKTRWIRVINTLTSQEQLLQVCSEETLAQILQRYLRYNAHVCSYTWTHDGEPLDMSRTLSQNLVLDQDHELQHLRLDRDRHRPALLLHFNDDLTDL